MYGQGMPIEQDVNFFLKVLLELEAILSDEQDFITNCHGFLQQLMGTMLISKGGILLFDPEDNRLVLKISNGVDEVGTRLNVPPDTFQQMLSLKNELILPQAPPAELKPFFLDSAYLLDKIESYIWVPLRVKDTLLGFLSLGDRFGEDEYSAKDLKILKVAAHLLSLSVYNQILEEGVKRQNKDKYLLAQEVRAVRGMSIMLKAVSGMDQLVQVILQQAVKLMQSRNGAIYMPQRKAALMKAVAQIGLDEEKAKSYQIPQNNASLMKCVEGQQSIMLNGEADPHLKEVFESDHLLASPILVDKEVFGIVVIGEREGAAKDVRYEAIDLKLFTMLSQQAALAVRNYLAYQELSVRNKRLKNIINNVPVALAIIGLSGDIELINRTFLQLFPQRPGEIIGTNFRHFFARNEAVTAFLESSLSADNLRSEHLSAFVTDGGEFPVNISTAPRKDARGRVTGLLLSLEKMPAVTAGRDMFEEKVSPEMLKQLNEGQTAVDVSPNKQTAAIGVFRIANLAELTETLPASEFFSLLNQFFTYFKSAVFDHEGMILSLDASEAIVAFGLPVGDGEETYRAIKAVYSVADMVSQLNADETIGSSIAIKIASGVAEGGVLAGVTQEHGQDAYRAAGEAVQIARHLCTIAKEGETLVNPAVSGTLENYFRFEKLKRTRVKGWEKQVQTYRLAGKVFFATE